MANAGRVSRPFNNKQNFSVKFEAVSRGRASRSAVFNSPLTRRSLILRVWNLCFVGTLAPRVSDRELF